MEFSKKLKKLRKEKGVSQQILANAVFVSRSAVAKWENGLGLPSEESLDGLANFFNIPKEFLKTDTPEIIVVEKNKKIKKLSGSMYAIIFVVVSALIIYALFHPISYYASSCWSKVEVQTAQGTVSGFQITDENIVNNLIDLLNAATFRKSLRISNEAPDNLVAVFYIRGDNADGSDIWLCSAGQNNFSVYVWTGKKELVACNSENLGNYLFHLIEDRY